jgi:hypothetical protein
MDHSQRVENANATCSHWLQHERETIASRRRTIPTCQELAATTVYNNCNIKNKTIPKIGGGRSSLPAAATEAPLTPATTAVGVTGILRAPPRAPAAVVTGILLKMILRSSTVADLPALGKRKQGATPTNGFYWSGLPPLSSYVCIIG